MKWIISLLIIFLVGNVCAVRINEVEMNPSGLDTGNEWVEFYCDEEINLSSYKIVNNDGDEIELNESCSGYFVYIFVTQWLDNSDEKVFLYYDGELIDETDLLKDSRNNDLTLQFCDSWEFRSATQGEENDCSEKEIEEVESFDDGVPPSNDDKKVIEENLPKGVFRETSEEVSTRGKIEIISLTKDIKSENGEDLKSKFAMYGFVMFCVLLCFLFLMKGKNKINKTEFEDE